MSSLDRMLGRRDEQHLSDLQLDRYLAGEGDTATVDSHIAGCEPCAARLASLRAEHAEFENRVWIRGEAAKLKRTPRRSVVAGAAMAIAAMLAFIIALPNVETTRTKGADLLEVIAQHDDGSVEQILPGGTLEPGDAIRFRLSTKRAGWITVVGLDEAGHVSVYVPQPNARSVRLNAGDDQVLDGSIILDETPGAERLVAFVCEAPVSVDFLVAMSQAALDRTGSDPREVTRVQPDCREATFLFEKVTP